MSKSGSNEVLRDSEKKKDQESDNSESEESSEEESEEENFVDVPFEDDRWSKPVNKGWLSKYTVVFGKKSWKRRFFILNKTGGLWHFKSAKKKQPIKSEPFIVKGREFWKSSVHRHCIEINQESKPYLIAAKSMDEISDWITKLQSVGGKYNHMMVGTELSPLKISQTPVTKWKNGDILDWMSMVPFNSQDSLSLYEEVFKKENIDGEKLLTMNDVALKKLGIKRFYHRKVMLTAIRDLRAMKKFDVNYHIVLKKILRMIEQKGADKSPGRHQISLLARNLSQKEHLRETYLSLESMEALIKERKRFISEEEDVKNEESDSVSSDSEEEEEESEGESSSDEKKKKKKKNKRKKRNKRKKKEEEEKKSLKKDLTLDFSKDIKGTEFNLQKVKKYKKGVPVKLIITEIANSNRARKTRKLLSPILSSFGRSSEFGMFHSAILIGPFYLEWTNTSLVVPRRAASRSALIAADIYEETIHEESMDELIDKMSEIIITWNTKKTYKSVNSKNDPRIGNCQEFVEDVITACGFNVRWEGAFGNFLRRLRKRGCCDMKFSPCKEFAEKFLTKRERKRKGIVFDTHKELDLFAKKVRKKDPEVVFHYVSEFRLLKSFDRAFWLRHIREPTEERFKPLEHESVLKKRRKKKKKQLLKMKKRKKKKKKKGGGLLLEEEVERPASLDSLHSKKKKKKSYNKKKKRRRNSDSLDTERSEEIRKKKNGGGRARRNSDSLDRDRAAAIRKGGGRPRTFSSPPKRIKVVDDEEESDSTSDSSDSSDDEVDEFKTGCPFKDPRMTFSFMT